MYKKWGYNLIITQILSFSKRSLFLYGNHKKIVKHSPGFTIVELLLVVVVIAILAAITIVAYSGIQNRAKGTVAISNAQQVGKKVAVSAIADGEVLPDELEDVGILDADNLSYQYTPNTNTYPHSFCLTATTNGTSAHVVGTTSGVQNAVLGPCAGHSGVAPITTAAGDCPAGYIVVPGSSFYGTDAFCVMQYEAKNSGGVAVSAASGAPWASITQTAATSTAAAACEGCHLITEAEWLTIAQNVLSVPANWSGGTVGSGCIFRGNNGIADACGYNGADPENGTGRNARASLTLTNGEVIWDFAGNVWEWTAGTTSGGQPGAGGYAWRNWNALTVPGALTPNPYPSYANPSASGWTSSHGIGQIYSDSNQAALRAYRRGGAWSNGALGGVFTLHLNDAPSFVSSDVGFRVAR